ncbi:MAG: hypothetical protein DDT19_01186 [Syntrophomonadaceae bacterium]|nr:hypothetical protein [Bacillota bacterium]
MVFQDILRPTYGERDTLLLNLSSCRFLSAFWDTVCCILQGLVFYFLCFYSLLSQHSRLFYHLLFVCTSTNNTLFYVYGMVLLYISFCTQDTHSAYSSLSFARLFGPTVFPSSVSSSSLEAILCFFCQASTALLDILP